MLAGLALLAAELHKTVQLEINGDARTVTTWAVTVGGLLQQQGITLDPADYLAPPASAWLNAGSTIRIQPAYPVNLLADGRYSQLTTAERKPGNILAEAGIALYPGDVLLVNGLPAQPEQALDQAAGQTLQLHRAVPVTIITPQNRQTIYSSAPTLGRALWEAGITFTSADRLDPPADTPLSGPIEAHFLPAHPNGRAEGAIARAAARNFHQRSPVISVFIHLFDYPVGERRDAGQIGPLGIVIMRL